MPGHNTQCSLSLTKRFLVVLGRIVRGLAETAGLALARIWLLAPGDICPTCPMRAECPDQTQCLHLVASAGRSQTEPPEAWARTNGTFRRIPLGVLKVGWIAASAEPIWLPDVHENNAWIARPEWARAEGIRSFAGHPLVFRGELLGVLAVFCRDGIDATIFGWLRAFAAQAATAIANARAFGELTRLRERVELERDYLREEVRAAARGDECEQRNTRSAVTAVTDPESRCEPEGLSRTPRFVTRGNNNRHQPPLLDTWAWRILSFFGRLAWFKSPPRTPTT